jgi:hypothetical protein
VWVVGAIHVHSAGRYVGECGVRIGAMYAVCVVVELACEDVVGASGGAGARGGAVCCHDSPSVGVSARMGCSSMCSICSPIISQNALGLRRPVYNSARFCRPSCAASLRYMERPRRAMSPPRGMTGGRPRDMRHSLNSFSASVSVRRGGVMACIRSSDVMVRVGVGGCGAGVCVLVCADASLRLLVGIRTPIPCSALRASRCVYAVGMVRDRGIPVRADRDMMV